MFDELTIILPTLNERGNLLILIPGLLRTYRGVRIIVVDDGSSDGTRELVREMALRNSSITLLDRQGLNRQRGLTASVIDGIVLCKTKLFVVMDADLQHPAGTISRIVRKLDTGYDIVVATRSSVKGWALHRKLISKSLHAIAKAELSLRGRVRCNDVFSGFFGMRKSTFVSIYGRNRERFVGEGYKILFDTLKCSGNGTVRIAEIPYAFRTRKYGGSKAGIAQGMALLKSLLS